MTRAWPSSTPALGATITVDDTLDDAIGFGTDGDCSLREAINAADFDMAVDTCAAGSGADTIVLGVGQTYLRWTERRFSHKGP